MEKTPEHYRIGGIQPIDYMRLKMSKERYAGFLQGNVIKYISRYEHKGGVEDLKKAKHYLELLIEWESKN